VTESKLAKQTALPRRKMFKPNRPVPIDLLAGEARLAIRLAKETKPKKAKKR